MELMILVSDFMMNSILKNTQKVFLWNAWNVLTKMQRRTRKKDISFTSEVGRDDKITTSAKLLDIMHKPYGFSGNLMELID